MDENSETYSKFIESMTHLCHCSEKWGRPCDGVLAGGLCDNMGNRDRDLCTTDESQDLPCACGITGVPTHPTTREDNAGPAIVGMPASGAFHIIAPPQVPYDQTAAGKAAIERVRRIARDWSFK